MPEEDARILSRKGPIALREEGIRRLGEWHTPIPEILQATNVSLISGYPIYDREMLELEILKNI
jgi:hypothetical protein